MKTEVMTAEMSTLNFKAEDLNDVALIKRVVAGDKSAFTELFNKYSVHLLFKFRSYLKSEADAEDVLMITMAKVYEKLHTYKPEKTFNSWITRVGHNTMIDWHRDSKNSGRADNVSIDSGISSDNMKEDSASITYQIKDDCPTPEQVMISKERRNILNLAIDMLDTLENSTKGKLYKKAIKLIYMEEKTYEEAASILGIKVTSLKPYIFRARKIIEKNIKLILSGRGNYENNVC